MYNDTNRLIQRHLAPGEQLLWSGRPLQGFMLRPGDALTIPFSIVWAGFAVFWESGALRAPGAWFAALWGVPFVLVGLYITVGRFFYDAYQRSQTIYALTNERVMFVRAATETAFGRLRCRLLGICRSGKARRDEAPSPSVPRSLPGLAGGNRCRECRRLPLSKAFPTRKMSTT